MFNQIQYIKMPQSETLNSYTENKLERLLKRFEMIQKIKVNFKLENSTPKKGKVCEIECSVPGAKYRAVATMEHFENSVKLAFELISRQLAKKKALLSA